MGNWRKTPHHDLIENRKAKEKMVNVESRQVGQVQRLHLVSIAVLMLEDLSNPDSSFDFPRGEIDESA